jgi:hypothetical protein
VLQALMAILKTVPGHEVKPAANAQKAHENAAAMGGCDLLITDVVMEPTDGFTTARGIAGIVSADADGFHHGYDLSDYSESDIECACAGEAGGCGCAEGLDHWEFERSWLQPERRRSGRSFIGWDFIFGATGGASHCAGGSSSAIGSAPSHAGCRGEGDDA